MLVAAHVSLAGQWQGYLGASSDNVYRGLSQNRSEAAWFGDAHWRHDAGWFAGLGVATVNLNPGPGAPLEFTGYLGRGFAIAPALHGKLTLLHYEYPSDSSSLPYGYEELVASISYRETLALNLTYSPNTSRFSFRAIARHRPAYSAEITTSVPLGRTWRGNLGLGRYVMAAPIDSGYWYWNAGVEASRGNWQLSLSAIGTDQQARRLFGANTTGQRFVASLMWRFSTAP